MKNLQNSASITVVDNNATFVKLESIGNNKEQIQITVESKFDQEYIKALHNITFSDKDPKDKDNEAISTFSTTNKPALDKAIATIPNGIWGTENEQTIGQMITEKAIGNPGTVDAKIHLAVLEVTKTLEVNYILENYSSETLAYIGIPDNSTNAIRNAFSNEILDVYSGRGTPFEKLKTKLDNAEKKLEQESKDQEQKERQKKENEQRRIKIKELEKETKMTKPELKELYNQDKNFTPAQHREKIRKLKQEIKNKESQL